MTKIVQGPVPAPEANEIRQAAAMADGKPREFA